MSSEILVPFQSKFTNELTIIDVVNLKQVHDTNFILVGTVILFVMITRNDLFEY